MGVKAKRALIAHFRKDFDEAGRSERGRVLYTLFQTTGRVRKHAMHAWMPPPTRFGCSGANGYPMGQAYFVRVPPQTRFGVLRGRVQSVKQASRTQYRGASEEMLPFGVSDPPEDPCSGSTALTMGFRTFPGRTA